jgi:hypothetical protein
LIFIRLEFISGFYYEEYLQIALNKSDHHSHVYRTNSSLRSSLVYIMSKVFKSANVSLRGPHFLTVYKCIYHILTYIYIYIWRYMYVCMYVCIYMYTCTNVCIHKHIIDVYACMCVLSLFLTYTIVGARAVPHSVA